MIEKIKFSNTIDDGMQYSSHWIMAEALNRIIDGFNGMDERLKKIEMEFECNCYENQTIHYVNSMDDTPIESSWFCPKHGRQTIE